MTSSPPFSDLVDGAGCDVLIIIGIAEIDFFLVSDRVCPGQHIASA
jgi:hypothetical protein